MRIMHVITGLEIGGAESMLEKLLALGAPEWDSVVVSLSAEGPIGARIAELGIPVLSLGLRRGLPNPVSAISIIPMIRRCRPVLVQGWMPHGNLMASFAVASQLNRMPVVWNIRMSLDDTTLPALTRAAIRSGGLLSRHPVAIVYNSAVGARQHEAVGYRKEKSVVIPNGFDCGRFHPDNAARRSLHAELGLREDAVLIGLVARYDPIKDHAGFLGAAGRVARSHPGVYFVLAGKGVTGEEPALMKVISEAGLQGRIFLLGERQDVSRLTAALDIACSSSTGEGFANTIGEAMACGVPCVVTDVGDSAYIVADTGMAVPPGSPGAFAQALCQMIEAGPEHRQRLGMLARRRVEQEFSLPAIARRYKVLYQEHVSAPRPNAI
jgi:glycosyltransferase involved in cell wall biosynthesis